jgi:hypothetical protein
MTLRNCKALSTIVSFMLSVVMLSVVMLNVVMLRVIILSGVVPLSLAFDLKREQKIASFLLQN